MARAEDILTAPGVDMGFVGPNDLAWSMGVEPGSVEHEAAIADALAVARRVGRPLGILTADGAAAHARIQQGFLFVGVGSDLTCMKAGAARSLRTARGE